MISGSEPEWQHADLHKAGQAQQPQQPQHSDCQHHLALVVIARDPYKNHRLRHHRVARQVDFVEWLPAYLTNRCALKSAEAACLGMRVMSRKDVGRLSCLACTQPGTSSIKAWRVPGSSCMQLTSQSA